MYRSEKLKKLRGLISLILIFITTVGCTNVAGDQLGDKNKKTIEVMDAADHTLNVPHNPQRVAVFDNAQIDNLDALELGERITAAASSRLPHYLNKYNEVEVAGTLHEIDLEIAMATDPDLAIVATRSASSFDELSKYVPTLDFSLTKASAFESMSYNFLELSKIFDKEVKAQTILDELENEKIALAQTADESKMTALMLMYNEGSLSVFGKNSRFSHVYDDFGFEPVDDQIEASKHGMEISYEYIIQKDPDVIFVLDRSAAISDNVDTSIPTSNFEENPLIEETKAYKNHQIIYLTPDAWYLSNGGVQAYQQMIEDVSSVFK